MCLIEDIKNIWWCKYFSILYNTLKKTFTKNNVIMIMLWTHEQR